jgi:penicillin-binding protein 2
MKPNSFLFESNNIRKPNLKFYLEKKWEGDSFLGKTSLADSLTRLFDEGRVKLLFIFFVSLFVLLVFRVFWFQILRGSYYYNLAEGNRIRIEHLRAERGFIFDRYNKVLAQNKPNFVLSVIPADLPRDYSARENLFNQVLAKIPQRYQIDFVNQLSSLPLYTYEPIILLNNLSYEEAIKLKIELAEIPGFLVEVRSQRFYPVDKSFSHLLGYIGKVSKEEIAQNKNYLLDDEIGKSGIEAFYESFLRGYHGQKQIEVDSLGKERGVIGLKAPVAGRSIVLSIDEELQNKVAEALVKMIHLAGARAGAAVALDPRNGDVLALVSYPFFDNNLLVQGISGEEFKKLSNHPDKLFFNRAIAGEYPSGSIIKPLIALAALEEKIITPQTIIYSSGGLSVGQWFFADWKAGGHGPTNVIKALAESVNTFFYYLGGGYGDFRGLGPERLSRWLQLFGLGQISNIDLPGERSGLVPSPEWKKRVKNEPWYIGDTYHLSIGQGDILVTPLQVATFTAAIANGGKIFQPQILKTVLDDQGQTIFVLKPKITNILPVKDENIKVVQGGLRAAVVSGSARQMLDLPIKAAGKTGTAEVGYGKKPHAWFTCFAPYDQPEIVLTVLIENGGEGSRVALPVAKEVLGWWATHRITNPKL